MSTYTMTTTTTFTVTHARHMAAKVAADLKRIQRFYGGVPSDKEIADYEAELTELINGGYLSEVTYGFKRGGNWIEPMLRYTAADLAGNYLSNDDDPGKVRPGADTSGAIFYSYLEYSSAWYQLSSAEQAIIKSQLPVKRSGAPTPGITGYLQRDLCYSAGGRALNRSSLRSY